MRGVTYREMKMDNNDRRAIEALFAKLGAVETRVGPRDPEAEAFIRSAIAAQPGAPYYMAQTIIVQEQALEAANRRIEALEAEERRDDGGFLSGLFGIETALDDGAIADSTHVERLTHNRVDPARATHTPTHHRKPRDAVIVANVRHELLAQRDGQRGIAARDR